MSRWAAVVAELLRSDRLGEIETALLDAGMELTGEKEWRLRDRPWRLPHSYTLQAVKRE